MKRTEYAVAPNMYMVTVSGRSTTVPIRSSNLLWGKESNRYLFPSELFIIITFLVKSLICSFIYEYFKCDYHNITAAETGQNATLTLSVLLHLAWGTLTFIKQHTSSFLLMYNLKNVNSCSVIHATQIIDIFHYFYEAACGILLV